ncbi:MAG: multidrug effflux MFS transporter [Alphaproteobacteria bacterium]
MTTSPHPRTTTKPVLIGVLMGISGLNALAISILIPSLPSIRTGLSADVASTQLVLSGFLFALAAGQLVVGPLADLVGRRPVVFGGLAVFAAASFVAAVSTSITVLVMARILQGLGGAAGVVVSRAVIRDLFDQDRAASVLGYVTMGLAVGPMVAPFLGGTIDDALGWRAIFVLLASAGILIGLLAWRVLPETATMPNERPRGRLTKDIAALLGQPAFWAYAMTGALISATYFSFIGGIPFVANELVGLSSTQIGGALLFVSVGYFTGNFISGRFTERLGTHFMIQGGNAIVVAAITFMLACFVAGYVNIWTMFVPVAWLGLGNGMSLPSVIAGSMSVRPDLAGTASGLAGSLQFGTGALSAVLVGAALSIAPSAITVAAVMGSFALASTLTGLWSRYLGR